MEYVDYVKDGWDINRIAGVALNANGDRAINLGGRLIIRPIHGDHPEAGTGYAHPAGVEIEYDGEVVLRRSF